MAYLILTVLSIVFCQSYLIAAKKVTGNRQPSISQTYYEGMGWWFLAFCAGTGMPLLPVLLELTPEPWKVLCLVAVFGLVACGCAPRFLHEQRTEHYLFAGVCLVFSQLLVLFVLKFWPVSLACFAVCGYRMFRDNKRMYWLEIAAIYSTHISALIICLKYLQLNMI